MPSDDEWYRAVAQIRASYPEDIFPPDSPSIDARSGTFARSLCDQIVRLAEQFNAEQYDGFPAPPDDDFCEHGTYWEMPCPKCAQFDGEVSDA